MNWEKLDQELTEIVQQRIQLSALEYSDENYDDLEEQLHDLEDDFNENYEEVLAPELEKIYTK
jgi:acyl carrier protein phosphodiesterase